MEQLRILRIDPGEPVRILFVDDEENVLKSLKRVFLDYNYEIITVTTVEEGIGVLENTSPVQLVVSDYRMPGTNGVDFLKQVCKRWPDTIRMVLSGYADTASVVSAINEGHIYKFIAKPWNDDELKITIGKAIEHYYLGKKNKELSLELKKKNEELTSINKKLEQIVLERTAKLIFQNKVLKRSQNILDSLPVGVIGIDPEGLVVQCNMKAKELLGKDLIGTYRMDSLPPGINSAVDEVVKQGECIKLVSTARGISLKVRGSTIWHSKDQQGVVIVMDIEEQ